MKFLYLIWRNLMRKKIRTALNLLSMLIAFLLFGALLAVKAGLQAGVDLAGLDRMITIHKVSLIQPLPESYGRKMLAVDGVAQIAHGTWFGGVYQDPKNFFGQFAVDPGYPDMYPEMQVPDAQKQAWLDNRTGALVGRLTADRFGWQVGDRIPLQGTIWRTPDDSAWEFVIEGIYDADKGFDTSNFLFHHEYLTETTGIEGYVGLVHPAHRRARALGRDRSGGRPHVRQLAGRDQDFDRESVLPGLCQPGGQHRQDRHVGPGGGLLHPATGRRQHHGPIGARAVQRNRCAQDPGLHRLGVLGLVLGESYLVTLLGGGAGLALAVAITRSLDLAMLPSLYLPPSGIWLGVALLLVMGFVAGAIPRSQAQRLTIVDALRRT